MSDTYGLPEYKALLERELKRLADPMQVPFGCDPSSAISIHARLSKRESINYALEMLPDLDEVIKLRDRVQELEDQADYEYNQALERSERYEINL